MSRFGPGRPVTPLAIKLKDFTLHARLYAGALIVLGVVLRIHATHTRTELSMPAVVLVIAALLPLVPFMWEGRSGLPRNEQWAWFWSRPLLWKLGWLGIMAALLFSGDATKRSHNPGDGTQVLGMLVVILAYAAIDMAGVVGDRVAHARSQQAQQALR